MDEENGSLPPQASTHNSEGRNEPDTLHVDRNLPKYLTETLRKDDHTKYLADLVEDNEETGLG